MRNVIIILACLISTSLIGQKIHNPYSGVSDFSKSYKSMIHGHTDESDGAMTPEEYISAYSELEYDIISITDHNIQASEPTWTLDRYITQNASLFNITGTDTTSAYYSDIDGNGPMFTIPGNEISNIDHMNQWFTDTVFGSFPTITAFLDAMVAREGLTQFNHPRMYSRNALYYDTYFDEYYGTILGIEVFNKNDLYPDNGLWDSINSLRPCDSLIWGFSNDDQHEATFTGRRSDFHRHYIDTLTEAALKENMITGGFTFSAKLSGESSEVAQPVPVMTDVDVSGTVITLTFTGEDSVVWFDNRSNRIDHDSVIDVHNVTTHFVRAVAYNTYGTTWTQPFGVDTTYNVYYCQDTSENVNASDSNAGTDPDYPWATWNYAFQNADEPGDTVFFRDGTWYTGTGIVQLAVHDPTLGYGDSGTYEKPIVFIAYPGETPILDASKNVPPGVATVGVEITNSAYIELNGLIVQNVYSVPKGGVEVFTQDFVITDMVNVTLKNCVGRYGGGVGFSITRNDTVTLTNCDAHDHCDSLDLSDPGGDGDGFIINTGQSYSEGNHFIVYMTGCRAWRNSDDGVDLGTAKQFYLSNNWFFHNGDFEAPYSGDATGIKTSGGDIQDVTTRRVHNCITAFNDGGGIAELNLYSPSAPWMQAYNNTSYKDGHGYRSGISGGDWDYDNDSARIISANNLIYETTEYYGPTTESLTALTPDDDPYRWVFSTTDSWRFVVPNDYWYNEYNPAFTITDADFTNLDSATIYSQLSAARNTDGSLPGITVLKLAQGSDLINGGTDVGLSFNGPAPDLGAFESNYLSTTIKAMTGSGGVVSVVNGKIAIKEE
jgi:hypothetical protein